MSWVLTILLLASCGGTESAASAVVGERESESLAEARQLLIRGRNSEAFALFSRISENDRSSLAALEGLVESASNDDQKRSAERMLVEQGALTDGPEASAKATLLALLEPDLVRREERLQELISRGGPLAGWPHAAVGEILLQRGNPPAAVKAFRAALEETPTVARAHLGLARAAMASGRPNEAAPSYEAFLQSRPTDANALYNLGWILLNKRGRPRDALPYLERAHAILPDDLAILLALGAVGLESRPPDPELAERSFRAAEVLAPDDPDVHWNLGVLLADHLGQREEALRHLKACRDLGGTPRERILEAIRNLENKDAN